MIRHADEFTAFVAAHGDRLQRFGCLLTGDASAAQDLVQSSLLQAMRHWNGIKDRNSAEAYVRRTMVNKQRSLWRRRSGNELLPGHLPDRAQPDETTNVDDRDALGRALAMLPLRQRATVILRFYEDMSEAQVASLLGCSTGTVKSQTSKALMKLRAELGSHQEGAPHAH